TVQLSTVTGPNFDGDQFILMWNRGSDGGAVEGLAFFLNPPYTEPTGANVKVVNSWSDLQGQDLSAYDALDFESPTGDPVAIPLGGDGALAYKVPANILTIFLGTNSWVQGKLHFAVDGVKIYGPGVLDGSRFNYLNRDCLNSAGNPTEDGLYSLSTDK